MPYRATCLCHNQGCIGEAGYVFQYCVLAGRQVGDLPLCSVELNFSLCLSCIASERGVCLLCTCHFLSVVRNPHLVQAPRHGETVVFFLVLLVGLDKGGRGSTLSSNLVLCERPLATA